MFPRDPVAHLLMGRLLLRVDKKEEAIKELKLAIKYGGEGKDAQKAQVMLRTLEGEKAEDGRLKTEDGGRKAEDGGRKTEDGRTEDSRE